MNYPKDYNNLSAYQKEQILCVYDMLLKREDALYEFVELMESFGVFIEEGWGGHLKPFLATCEDAELRNEAIWSQMERDD